MFLICEYLSHPETNKVGNQRMSTSMADVTSVITCYAETGGHSLLSDFLGHFIISFMIPIFLFLYPITKLVFFGQVISCPKAFSDCCPG